MVAYVVTGKLGAGKSLVAVGRIKEYLLQGRPVASNLDLYPDKMFWRYSKATYMRIPDRPDINDLLAIGSGNESYDEELNGLLVLDECATWFDSRTWNAKGRSEVITWFLHARKLGWDLMFLIQDVEMLDSHARKSLAELTVFCKRLDRIKLPIIGALSKLVLDKPLTFPKMHRGKVRYGTTETCLEVDTWTYTGKNLYNAYDTKQIFREDYPHATYSTLPPIYYNAKQRAANNWANKMRITKIYLKRLKQPVSLAAGLLVGVAMTTLVYGKGKYDEKPLEAITEESSTKPVDEGTPKPDAYAAKIKAVVASLHISGTRTINGNKVYEFSDMGDTEARTALTSVELAGMGVIIRNRSDCHVDVQVGEETIPVLCTLAF